MDLDDPPQPAREERVSLDELHVDGDNPNEQSDEMFGLLCENLRAKGWIGNAIVANRGDLSGYDGDPEGLIADGEHRWRGAKEIGLEEVPVKFYDFEDDAQRRLWRQELNKISGEHDPTRDALEYDALLESGRSEDVQNLVAATGEDLDELLNQVRADKGQPVPYEYYPEHAIHYEDCVSGMRDRLDEDSVDLVLTDPPYGVDVDLSGTLGATSTDHGGSVTNDGHDEAVDLWRAAVLELKRVLASDGHLYAFASWKTYDVFRDVLENGGFEVLNCLVWLKSTPNNQTAFGSGQRRYGYQHEFILYAVHEGGDPRELNRTMADAILHTHSTQNNEHPTQKPVGLLETLLEQSSDAGDLVLDPFAGSGSTLVAAVRNERDAAGFELGGKSYGSTIERRLQEAERMLESPPEMVEAE
jgi:DNA modification methylase